MLCHVILKGRRKPVNTNIYIDDALLKRVNDYTNHHHVSRSALIREALKDWLNRHSQNQWRQDFFDFEGAEDFPLPTQFRESLLSPNDDPLS